MFSDMVIRTASQKGGGECSHVSDLLVIVLNCCKMHGRSYTSTDTVVGDFFSLFVLEMRILNSVG